MASLMTAVQREAFVRRVRLAMAKNGLSRNSLARSVGCNERTLGNLLGGQPVRDATVAGVARALSIDLDEVFRAGVPGTDPAAPGRAADEYGGYLLAAYEDYLGTYVAYRRVFAPRRELYRSVFELDWDDELSRLRFFEIQRFNSVKRTPVASSHAGGVYISAHTGVLHFLTTFQGALRLVTLSKFRRGDDKLRGVLLTQSDHDMFYLPAVSAIYLQKLNGRRRHSELDGMVGVVTPDDPAFRDAEVELAEIERSALFLGGAGRVE